MYHVLADFVLLMHLMFIFFVVLGQMLIMAGGLRQWQWVRHPGFRWAHLLAIGLVVAQSWLGIICPLTDLEMALREKAGDLTYEGTFIAHWLHQIIFLDASPWVFTLGYTLFGLAVMASWWWIKPRPFHRQT